LKKWLNLPLHSCPEINKNLTLRGGTAGLTFNARIAPFKQIESLGVRNSLESENMSFPAEPPKDNASAEAFPSKRLTWAKLKYFAKFLSYFWGSTK